MESPLIPPGGRSDGPASLFTGPRAVRVSSFRGGFDVPAFSVCHAGLLPSRYGVPIEDFGALLRETGATEIRVVRWGCVGDVLMAAVGAHMIARAYGLPVAVVCDPKIAGKRWTAEGVRLGPPSPRVAGARPLSLVMDRVYETDHKPEGDPLRWGVNRVRMTAHFAGIVRDDAVGWAVRRGSALEPLAESAPRWDIVRPTVMALTAAVAKLDARRWARDTRTRPLAVVNGASANSEHRSVLPENVEAAVRALVADGFLVVMADGRRHPWIDKALSESVMSTEGSDIGEALAYYREADVAVSTDSGSLWFAHAAARPLVYWEGVSDYARVLSDFPLGPDGFRVVRQAESVGCKPCGEASDACGHRLTCQRGLDREWFVRETVGHARALIVGAAV